MIEATGERWTAAEATDLYNVERWSNGYFSIGEDGHVFVHPDRDRQTSIDLKAVVDQVQNDGLELPVLLRFNGILKDRLREMRDVFAKAISEHDYQGTYSCVYPIKVNQQRHVVEEIIRHSRRYGFGLEAGSKPELLAVVAMNDANLPIICNGFKDPEFLEMAMLAHKLGRFVIPVIEKYTELERILDCAQRMGVRPRLGVRVKLMARGAGRWQASGGSRSKFGLSAAELLRACQILEERGMVDCLKMTHFHLGSQITNIRRLKSAINEAARVYCDLVRRGMEGLECFNVGGGLGVDYDGSQTDFDSSMNYSLQEYANDVIYHTQMVCDDAGVAHPHIYSESGRAVAAYHSVLVFGVLGVAEQGQAREIPETIPEDFEQPLHTLKLTWQEISPRNILESLHDAQLAMDTTHNLFSTGHLTLEQRCVAENLYWAICRRIRRLAEQLEFVPEELDGIDYLLADTYFCNFSIFQSLPDSWAVKQLFPIMPIHRLSERPERHAVLADITCDSDGKIDRFINRRDVKRTLPLHPFDGSPYYLGAFLTGAYQEILGDLHNLFGDTNMIHVDRTEDGEIRLKTVIRGDTVNQVLGYVQFDGQDLIQRLQKAAQVAVKEQRMNEQDADHMLKFYEEALGGYTYLEEN